MNENEKKEIEEMARIMCGHKGTCQDCLRECTRFGFAFDCECLLFAEKVYKKGYRKQSERRKKIMKRFKHLVLFIISVVLLFVCCTYITNILYSLFTGMFFGGTALYHIYKLLVEED